MKHSEIGFSFARNRAIEFIDIDPLPGVACEGGHRPDWTGHQHVVAGPVDPRRVINISAMYMPMAALVHHRRRASVSASF